MKEGFYWFLSDNIADRMLYGRSQLYGMAPGWEMMEIYEAKGGLRVSGNRGGDNFSVPIAGLRGTYRGPVELPEKERTMKDKAFWVVWTPGKIPSEKYENVHLAERAATGLAVKNPGSNYHVLRACTEFVGSCSVQRTDLEEEF